MLKMQKINKNVTCGPLKMGTTVSVIHMKSILCKLQTIISQHYVP